MIKKLLKFFTPKIVLILTILSLIFTLLAFCARIYIANNILDLIGLRNTQPLGLLGLGLTLFLLLTYHLLINVNVKYKVISFLLSSVFIFVIVPKLGNKLMVPLTKQFYYSHQDDFKQMIELIKVTNVCWIQKVNYSSKYEMKDCLKDSVFYNDLNDGAIKLGFWMMRGKENLIFSYEPSRDGGYGFYFSKNKKEKPMQIEFGNTKNWIELEENIYYFSYN